MAEFRFQSHRTRARRRQLLLVTIFVAALFLIDFMTGGMLRGALRRTGSAAWTATEAARAAIADTGYFRTHRALARENAILRDQVSAGQEDSAALDVARQQIAQLAGFVHLAGEERGATAPVVSSFTTSPYGTFVIGAGADDGIALHSLALTPDGFVIGTVVELHPHEALVSGILAGGNSIDALVGPTATVLEGRGGGNGRAMLPRDTAVATGTPVIAPTLGSRPIGVVGRVISSEANTEETAYVVLPINLSTLRYVFLVAPRS